MAENYAIMPLPDYEAACDAIREKTGGSDPITSGEMAAQIQGITGGGDDTEWMFTGIAPPAPYTYTGDSLRNYAFALIGNLGGVTLSNVVKIPSYCCYDCDEMSIVSAPVATYLGRQSFSYCDDLVTANFPAATEIADNAFYLDKKLSDVLFPEVTKIGDYAFYGCAALQVFSAPKLVQIGGYVFRTCAGLQSVDFPSATTLKSYVFEACAALESANFPVLTSIGSYAFANCPSLRIVDIGIKTSIANSAFAGQSNKIVPMSALILRGTDGISDILTTAAFNYNYIKTSTDDGYIYVPSALLETYAGATNWSTYATKFRALEDWPKIDDWRNWESDANNFATLAEYLAYYSKEENR